MNQSILNTLKLPFLLLALLFFPYIAQASNKIVAIVNDEVITQHQLNQNIQTLQQQSRAEGKTLSAADTRKEALDQLIGNKLQLQIAKQNNVTATEAEVNQYLKNIASQNNLSMDQFKQALQKEGLSYNAYKDFLRNRIILEKLHSQFLFQKVKISDHDVSLAMAQAKDPNAPAHIIDILIAPVSEKEIAKAKIAAAKVRQQLVSGKSIDAASKSVKQNHLKISEQDFGWKPLSDLPTLFAKAVQHLGKGQVSQIIEAPNGIHLLKVVDRKGHALSKEDAQKFAFFKKLQIEVKKWVEELKKQAYIEIK